MGEGEEFVRATQSCQDYDGDRYSEGWLLRSALRQRAPEQVRLFGKAKQRRPFHVIVFTEKNMKHYLLAALAILGLVALIPTESQAQVFVSIQPGYSSGYYYHGQPYYYRNHRYHHYYHQYNNRAHYGRYNDWN
jgi:hypothetical protein